MASPKLSLASVAFVAPVPPLLIAIVVPLQIPEETVPRVVIWLEPPHVFKAIFSTFPNPTLDLLIPIAILASVIEASAIRAEVIFELAICLVKILPSLIPPALI